MRILLISFLLAGCETQDVEKQDAKPTAEATTEEKAPWSLYDPPADVAAPPEDAKKTESGLAYKVLRQGNGTQKPSATSEVEVHYTGWQTDGTMFDSSHKRNKTAKFPLNRVIAGWTEGLQLMVAGEKTRF